MASSQRRDLGSAAGPLIPKDKIGFVSAKPHPGRAPAVTLRQALAWSRFFAESTRRNPFRRTGWLGLHP